MVKKYLLCLMLIPLVFILAPVLADETIREIDLQPVYKDIPSFKRAPGHELGAPYSIRLTKIHDDPRITVPPDTKANVLYYGSVTLGNPGQDFGILIDLESKEKYLWVDANANGNFAEESPYQLFTSDRYTGVFIYFSPLPLTFDVNFDFEDHKFQTKLIYDLTYLAVAQSGLNDFLFLRARTWLTGAIDTDEAPLQFAMVDADDNGSYVDPQDLIFFDTDYDLNYSLKEGKFIKRQKTIRLNGVKYQIDYQYCPEKLILQKG